MDIDTIAENQNTCSVKLIEGNQNNLARLTTLSAGTDRVFGKSKINLCVISVSNSVVPKKGSTTQPSAPLSRGGVGSYH